MSDAVTREQLAGLIQTYESTLRSTYEDGRLPADWEETLGGADRSTAVGALKYFGLLKVYTYVRYQENHGRGGKEADPQDAQEAARALLRRDPVRVTLASGREIEVTGRSYNAYLELAQRGMRLRILEAFLDELQREFAAQHTLWRASSWTERKAVRRELSNIERLYVDARTEYAKHKAWLWATAMTPNGAVAGEGDSPPPWWEEATLEDEVTVILALLEAGPHRYTKLGDQPQPAEQSKGKADDWGWHTLFAVLSDEDVDPSRPYNRDLFQQLAQRRGASPARAEKELGQL